MNAFNMIDGINGLCASMCLICFVSIIYIINADSIPSLFPLILPVGSIVGFLMYNLGILGDRTVFLGDNGSNALGFLCAWVLIYFSSVENAVISPVTALWLVAIPFVDAVGVISSRILNRLRVLNSHRDHIHHKMINANISSESTFAILILVSGFLAFAGLFFEKSYPGQSYFSFYVFIIFWASYYLIARRLSKSV
jgi:UDP-GlcNAc:undecaprenyl-phosphate GlcNAc-1-phosphate transferase